MLVASTNYELTPLQALSATTPMSNLEAIKWLEVAAGVAAADMDQALLLWNELL